MDDSQQNIFSSLANHEEKPPPGLYNDIISKLREEETTDIDSKLQSLKDFATTPPPAFYEEIRNTIVPKEKGILFYLNKYKAVAAILILGLITFGITNQRSTKNNIKDEIVIKKNEPAIINIDSTKEKPGNNNQIVSKAGNEKIHTRNPVTKLKSRPARLEMSFIDNDLLTSFTECTECNFAAFFSKKGNLVITLDPYSSVTVTKKMGEFMKTLYSTNRRSKPTPKAKRAKRTLQKWKKMDMNYFDGSTEKSALDPLDLTEFILDNK